MPSLYGDAVLRRRELPHLVKDPANLLGYGKTILFCVMLSVSWIIVFLRIVARLKIQSYGKDDTFIICAQVPFIHIMLLIDFLLTILRFATRYLSLWELAWT
jgi:hypothetical protein